MVEADHAGDSYAGALLDAFAPIASAVDDLRSTLDRDAGVEPALHRICTDLVGTLSGADAVGVTLFVKGRPFTAARSDAVVDRVDECQFRTGEGPCLLAAHEHRTVATDDAETRHRFPTFWYANIDTGIRGFLSIPMTVEPGRAGAINIYTDDHRGIGRLEAAAAQNYATTAEAAVSAAAGVWSLQARLDGRPRDRPPLARDAPARAAQEGLDRDELTHRPSAPPTVGRRLTSCVSASCVTCWGLEPHARWFTGRLDRRFPGGRGHSSAARQVGPGGASLRRHDRTTDAYCGRTVSTGTGESMSSR
ncbi:GAF domain-containing protein [Rhodococcoides kroppenstedtii]|uniref:GAF domain-containing protein n=1 Tax=Rhodococcoides kroppenstedtii TaxID=293050 RepID=UPI001427B6CF|nr:GAF domain-containing protein [Rhodococcus kroppenstedtii]NIL80421.1 hypothetical protein [Rhodococcus kroppenstedtii]